MRLDEVPIPEGAEGRAWRVVRAAFEERVPAPRRRSWKPLVAVAAAGAVALAALSPPGRAVLDEIRETVGVERAQPALFSLPAPGRLLVVSAEHGGVWLVRSDGSRRLIGDYGDAQWSPRGLFVVATRRNELLALTPDGKQIHWTLARRDAQSPRWAPSGYRIAYVARSGLRVVAGDGTGDRLLQAFAGLPAWRPVGVHQLAYALGDEIVLEAVDENRVLWRAAIGKEVPRQLEWSADGKRLLLMGSHGLAVLDGAGRLVREIPLQSDTLPLGAQWLRHGHRFAVQLRHEDADPEKRRSEVRLVDADHPGSSRLLFAGAGAFGDLAWSPDGRWLLVEWPDANQWLFVRVSGRPAVRAVANIAEQFPRGDGQGPLLFVQGRWCCVAQ